MYCSRRLGAGCVDGISSRCTADRIVAEKVLGAYPSFYKRLLLSKNRLECAAPKRLTVSIKLKISTTNRHFGEGQLCAIYQEKSHENQEKFLYPSIPYTFSRSLRAAATRASTAALLSASSCSSFSIIFFSCSVDIAEASIHGKSDSSGRFITNQLI